MNLKLIILFALTLPIISCFSSSSEIIPVIDTHIHFFDTEREEGIPWPSKTDKVLYKLTLPKDFKTIASEHHVKSAVVIQASAWLIDNQWNLDITKGLGDKYPGVVGNLSSLGTPKFKEEITTLSQNPRFVGVRITHRPEGRSFYTPAMINDLKFLAHKKLTLSILYKRFTFDEINQIATDVPDLKIILDHLMGHKSLNDKSSYELETMAKHKNVYCKVSGIGDRTNEETKKILEKAWQEFGEDRLVYGSNWPCTKNIKDGYGIQKQFFTSFFKTKGETALKKFFYNNAVQFFNLKF